MRQTSAGVSVLGQWSRATRRNDILCQVIRKSQDLLCQTEHCLIWIWQN